MATTVLLHLSGEDPVVGEVEELPAPSDTTITISNPRRRDGKDLPYLEGNVVTVVWPIHRVNFMEIMPTAEEERLIGFVRE
ncbi:MAG: hypothetical protein A2Z37_18265 [Chloroflexi bacterium RBG_19FT_COMBO_62_14]|jgi:hypothetical protein|nr:MAG: hypothetical protein A2Z37_18265 [Chloroflexi bacterium RBG_19FT_COMBO_62_14]